MVLVWLKKFRVAMAIALRIAYIGCVSLLIDIYHPPPVQLLIVLFVLFEILCYLMMRWADSALLTPIRRMVLWGALPVIEDEVDDIDYYRCLTDEIEYQFPGRDLNFVQCPRLAKQAAKFDTHAMFNRMSEEFADQNRRKEGAVASGLMGRDLESQILTYRRPTTIPHERQMLINMGYYDCCCGLYGDYSACETFVPNVPCEDSLHPYNPPTERPTGGSCQSIQDDIMDRNILLHKMTLEPWKSKPELLGQGFYNKPFNKRNTMYYSTKLLPKSNPYR